MLHLIKTSVQLQNGVKEAIDIRFSDKQPRPWPLCSQLREMIVILPAALTFKMNDARGQR
jgi:hypothetical protein